MEQSVVRTIILGKSEHKHEHEQRMRQSEVVDVDGMWSNRFWRVKGEKTSL